MHVVEDKQPRHQPGRQPRLLRTRRAHAGKALIEKLPIDLARQPHQRMAKVDDVFQCRPQQVPLPIIPCFAICVSPR